MVKLLHNNGNKLHYSHISYKLIPELTQAGLRIVKIILKCVDALK